MRLDEVLRTARELGQATCGVVTIEQLRLAGAETRVLEAARRHWRRLLRGVYLVDNREITDLVMAHAAVLFAGPGAVLTGLRAARWLGLRWVPEASLHHVLVPAERRRDSQAGVLVRRHRDVHELRTSDRSGLRVAPVAQVLVDSGRELGILHRAAGIPERLTLADVRGLVLGAVADRRCTVQEVRDVLEAGAVAGTALTRRACLDAERGAASPPEAELVDGLMCFGIPFYSNVEVWVDGVLLGVADAYLVGTGVGGELDSKERHSDADNLDLTLDRHARFASAGVELRHRSPRRFRAAPEQFYAELFDTVNARRSRGLGDPPGLELRPRGPLLRGAASRCAPVPYDVAA